jgi:hypothetical protein
MEKMKFVLQKRIHPGIYLELGKFQNFLNEKCSSFDYHERYDKLRSGMTHWEEYMLRLGIRKGCLERKGLSLFYDPAGAGWDIGCALDEIMAIPIMVPDTLVIKVLTLGHLPK